MPALHHAAYIALTSFTLSALATQLRPIYNWPLDNSGFGLADFELGTKSAAPSPFRKILDNTSRRRLPYDSPTPATTTYSDDILDWVAITTTNGDINLFARTLNADFEKAFSTTDKSDIVDLNAAPDLTNEADATFNWQQYFDDLPPALNDERPSKLSADEVYQAKRSRARTRSYLRGFES